MQNLINKVYKFIDDNKDEMVKLWEDIVNTESFTKDPANVSILANKLKGEFEKCGMDCKIVSSEPNGPTLIGDLGLDRKTEPILFSGHMDTVFKTGSVSERPFKIEDGKAYGPGVLDMKGGIIIALYTIKALNSIGYNDRPIKIIFSGDEECGHSKSNGGKTLLEEAKGCLCAFNMETGLVDDCLCVGRKGRIECKLNITGIEAHAGNDFASGRSAIEEAAFKIAKVRELTDLENGTTCVATVIDSPKISNSFPKTCSVTFDIRFEKMSEVDRIKAALDKIAAESVIGDTTCELEYPNSMMPYETTEKVLKLHKFVSEVAKENNFEEVGKRKLGGSSDASYLTIADVPTLCSCGVQGEWNHTLDEYAIVDSLFTRAKLWATVILNLDKIDL